MKKILIFSFIILGFLELKISYSQWQPDVRLTNDPATSYTDFPFAWSVAANGNMVHVLWWDYRDGNSEIYYKRSTDRGLTWGTDTRLTNSIGNSFFSCIAVSGIFVHVAWEDDRDGNNGEIYYKRSTDRGLSWGPDIRLTNDTNISLTPAMSVSGPFVNIVWADNRNNPFGYAYIYYKRSTDNGTSWGADTKMTFGPLESLTPSVSASGSNVNIVWADLRDGYNDGNWEIYYKRSTNCGLSWESDVRLTNNTAISEFPCVSASGLNIHVCWEDKRDGNDEIYYKHSTNGGTIWGSDTRLTYDSSYKLYSNITGCGQSVHVVWEEQINSLYQVHYMRSTNLGISWSPDTNLSVHAGNALNPSTAVSGPNLHVVWEDNRAGNYEIFYKRNPTGNISPTYTISGQVTYKDDGQPVNQGLVQALSYDRVNGLFIKEDSTTIQPGGYYTLPHVPQDSIYIMYYQNDEEMLLYVPTYYQSAIDWQQADILYPTENLSNIDGQVFRINNSGNSSLYIGGTCYTQNDRPTLPLDDVIIYAKIGNEFKNYGISDVNGVYTAPKLPPGDYTLFAYRIGYDNLTRNVTLSNNNLDTINFYFGPPIGIRKISQSIPLQMCLYQNYPNPFNPNTKIKYDIPTSPNPSKGGEQVQLEIYDVIGKEVAKLVNEKQNAGSYEVEWNASSFPSGVYFYCLRIGELSLSKKMILIK